MVLMAVFTTFITTPIVMAVYKPSKRMNIKAVDEDRSIQRKDSNTELRILACFHSIRNIASMLNLIEASRGTEKKEKLCVYAMHLMELTERPSAILMVHRARKNGLPFWNKARQSDSGQIVVAFEAFQQLSRVSIRPMTAISAISNIHEDICTSAERKRTAMIILPFHKHQRLDGTLETTRAEFRAVNKKVLEQAPCSVGILVDRGLGGATQISASNFSSNVSVVFFGGHDDCEALAFGLRMSEHPGISLNVVHLLPSPEMVSKEAQDTIKVEDDSNTSAPNQDEKSLSELKQKISKNKSIKYEQRIVQNSSETIEAIRDFSKCNLFLVGRSPRGVATSLNVKSECPELGPLGNLLTSPDFSTMASVLVVQQHQTQMFPTSSNVEATPEEA